MPVARGRRIAAALTPAALVMVMVSASAPRTAAADLSAPGARVVVPPTVSRTVPLAPRGFTPGMRGDVLRTRAATTSRPTVVCPGFRFTAVGLVWRQHGDGEVRARIRSGHAGAFGPASVVASDPDEGPSPGSPDYDPHRQAADLLWTGTRRCVRLTLHLPRAIVVSHLRAAFVNTSGTAGPTTRADALDSFGTNAIAEPSATGGGTRRIISRAQWGANPRYFDTGTPGCRAPYYSPRVRVAYVHHTAGSNSYGRSQADDVVRAIYWFHTQGRGFCDIAYNFLISRYGQIFEGRAGGVARPVTPGSQAGFNPDTFSVSMLGNFQTASPTRASLVALKRLLAWRLDVAHVPAMGRDTLVSQGGETTRYPAGARVTLPTIVGHRVTGLTSCPGIHLFRLIPGIRRAVARRRTPKILRPHQSSFTLRAGAGTGIRIGAHGTTRLAWTASVRNRSGHTVRRLHDHGRYLAVRWNGRDGSGHAVPAGKYRVVVSAHDAAGHSALPALLPVEVLGSSPGGALSPAFRRAPAAGGGFRTLAAVGGSDPKHVWAVGGTMTGPAHGHALVLQHIGPGWRRVAAPGSGEVSGFLADVAATSPSDVWAVGYRCGVPSCAGGGFGERTLVEHRITAGWMAVASPNPGTGADRLNAVTALSPSDAWAVGDALDEGIYLHQPLLEHWDGARWKAVRAPRFPGLEVHMTDLLSRAADDVWAVGHACLGNRGCGGAPGVRPVLLHYDGSGWSVRRTAKVHAAANSLEALATSGPDLFAVGWKSKTRHSNSRPLAERMRAGRWRIKRAPRVAGVLYGAGGVDGEATWAVGDRKAGGGFRTLIARRSDRGWNGVSSPNLPGRMSFLSSVVVLSRGDAWAAGPSVAGALLVHWNGSRWRLVRPG